MIIKEDVNAPIKSWCNNPEEQKDLVDIVVKLTPLGVVKAKTKPRRGKGK